MVLGRHLRAAAVGLGVWGALAPLAGCGHRVLTPELHDPELIPRPGHTRRSSRRT